MIKIWLNTKKGIVHDFLHLLKPTQGREAMMGRVHCHEGSDGGVKPIELLDIDLSLH